MFPTFRTAAIAATLLCTATMSMAGDARFQLGRAGVQNLPQAQINETHKDHLRNAMSSECVDLSVFASKSRIGPDRVRVTYGVKNVSRVNFVSGPTQQSVAISLNGRAMETHRFASLRAGQSQTWTSDVQTPFEFPDTYRILMTLGPDVYTDNNPANDDCRSANNHRDLRVGHDG